MPAAKPLSVVPQNPLQGPAPMVGNPGPMTTTLEGKGPAPNPTLGGPGPTPPTGISQMPNLPPPPGAPPVSQPPQSIFTATPPPAPTSQPPLPNAPSGPTMGIQRPLTPEPGAPVGGPPAVSSQQPLPASPTSPYAPPSSGGPFQGSANPNQLSGFDQFADAAYQQAQRRLDPQFAQQEARFRQDMVNRGISEGTDAYDNAFANRTMDKNDAYAQARNQALAQALAAQGQAFGQSFQNAGMAQQNSQFGQNLGYQYAGLNEQSRQANQNLGFNYAGLNEGGRQFNANLGQRESEFGRNFGFQGEQADFGNLMGLLGYGQQTNNANNAMLNADYNRAGGLFGLIPGMSPTQVDVLGPYQMQQNAAMQQQGLNNQASNGLWGSIGQIGSAFLMSDARLKTDVERVGTLDNGLPVYLARYTAGGPRMLMLMAQDVAQVKPEAVATVGDYLAVDYVQAVAA